MKKLLGFMTAGFAAAVLFMACSDGGGGNNGVSDPSNEPPIPPEPPAPAAYPVSDWNLELSKTVKNWTVSSVEDLKKLIELVNFGDSDFAGSTITLLNDITINEKVLTDDLLEPEEAGPGVPTEGLVNLDSIGRYHKEKDFDAAVAAEEGITGNMPFCGTIDGNGHVISGYYSYQGHEGLGFVGYSDGAVIKNLIMLDACVINMNTWYSGENKPIADGGGDHDGSDDDRFGGFVGVASGDGVIIENCVFVGVVGSELAYERDLVRKYDDAPAYEYIGGLIGRCDAPSEATNTLVVAKYYGDGDILCKKGVENIDQDNVEGILLALPYDKETVDAKIAEIKAIVAAN